MSSIEMVSGSLPTGLPAFPPIVPCAPMSPPAQLTRTSMVPKDARISAATRLTSASSVRSPQTGMTSRVLVGNRLGDRLERLGLVEGTGRGRASCHAPLPAPQGSPDATR